jgi:hypothetical protein
LQPGALFCVECGRSVAELMTPPVTPARTPTARSAVPPSAAPPAAASSVAGSPSEQPAVERSAGEQPAAEVASGVPHCPQCGIAIEPADIFCGECGFVLRPMTGEVVSAPEPGSAPYAEPASAPHAEPAPEAQPQPAPQPGASAPRKPLEDVESTRMMASRGPGERYVLQFSTGESIVVAGTGLIGRNPAPEPGEYVDELVTIFDVGKSVSKAHVEFGQESGRFWVSDRYSTNGTVVRQPDADPVRCEPGKRYMIARGSRVEIGEQFFIVS